MDRMKLLQVLARTLVVILCLGGLALPAAAGKRLALVIGNSDYQYAPKLRNPANDAKAIIAELKKLGFEVQPGINLTYSQFYNALSDFRARIKSEKAEDVVFYYAGHGFNLDGRNQFVPVDARLNDLKSIPYETFQLDQIVPAIQLSERQKTVILLDACRNSPLPPALQAKDPTVGLAHYEPTGMAANALLVFATGANQVSKDGKGRNSPFAHALLKYMGTPGESIDTILYDIRNDVWAETNNAQKPYWQGSPPAPFFFNPEPQIALNTPPAAPVEPPATTVEPPTATVEPPTATVEPPTATVEPPATTSGPLEPLKPRASDIVIGEEVAAPPTPQPQVPLPRVKPLPPSQPQTTAPLAPAAPLPPKPAQVLKPEKETPLRQKTFEMSSLQAQQGGSAATRPIERSATVPARSGTDILRPGQSERLSATVEKTGKTVQVASLGSTYIQGIEMSEAEVAALGVPGLAPPPPQGNDIGNLAPTDNTVPGATPAEPDTTLIADLQKALKSSGCYTGSIDGKWGAKSRRALESYLKVKGRARESAEPTRQMLDSLQADSAGTPTCVASLPPSAEPQSVQGVKHKARPNPSVKNRPRTQPAVKQRPPASPKVPIMSGF